MRNGRIKVWLSPLNGGSYTRLRLTGSAPTALPERDLLRLVEKLSFWSGGPVECALSVDEETADWCEWWTDRLAVMPGRLLEVRFVPRGNKREVGENRR